ncbi:MAG: septum site-determining protein MinC [Buchnera aphidicola (Periphyllus lyropictus)]|uniref:septum site-determining protein MinC n=1 Tax=Buchnera aphidicola TaxID=9 RepID=UPI001ED36A4C|nr:septum site-determining protein MinC [Buchnera aphidicola]NIH16809.1 septum site-determining protein MinC [Buchnera aphidicola (Periphyllus lyropictus)]USS94492.1 septum site-determining protein MinC [Buchnera aphidicola (Periphyllus lyropictus)]
MNQKFKKIPITFKGSVFTTLILYLKSNKVNKIYDALQKKIKESPKFFKNAPIIVNLSLFPKNSNWIKIQKVILSSGFLIIGISECYDLYLKKIIQKLGLPIFSNTRKLINLKKKSIKNKILFKSIIYKNTIRSGQTIYAKKSDLIIINNVNEGSELIADGNIHVYGKLSGRALAGAHGDSTRRIFCTNLYSELLSISGEYCLMDLIPKNILNKSAQIFLKKGIINIKKL